MTEVAKALSLNARILIMDEPTSALTEKEIKELFTTINRLKESGVSIIYISHRLEELYEIGDRVTVLRDGHSVAHHAISDIEESDLIRMMVDRELSEQYPRKKVEKGEEVLRVEDLSVAPHLHDISFNLHRGEILGLSGLLGSGRTELARAIFGVDRINSGKIFIDNRLRHINSPRKAINQKMGFLTEDRKGQGLVLNLSVKDNICLPSVDKLSKFGILNTDKEFKIAKKYIKELRIKTPGLDQKALYLSGGNQQKLVISKWLCSEADILIFDEPTRGIDVGSKVEIYQLMNLLTEKGAAIIMISSDLPEVLGMSDRILVMHEGRISAEYLAADATQEKILHSALGAA
jgi:ribose transport system ATP-binding protein